MPTVKAGQAVFATDVKDAFPSTSGLAVFNAFLDMGYGFNASFYLTCLTTWRVGSGNKFGLPQGAPTSPRLFDLCFWDIDYKLWKLASKWNGHYSRYADNIFFTATTFWPKRQKKKLVAGETHFFDKNGFEGWKSYKIKISKIPAGREVIEKNEKGALLWHSPVVSAIYDVLRQGYYIEPIVRNKKLSPAYRGWQTYSLHKSYLARSDQILHALGLNLIDGKLHNSRDFKRRMRMTIFNLQKALAQKDPFEDSVWLLFLKLRGMMNFAIKETLTPRLISDWEKMEEQVLTIRYSGPSSTWSKIKNY